MYQEHFGLEKRPFSSRVVGSGVFVGPHTVAAMGTIKKALATDDAVIAVTGPVGVGKTTVVKRALDTMGDNRIIITIGRLKLGYDEVIELLLAGLGAKQLPKSTVQRFAAFRRMLFQYGQQGTRVFILVEDASCIGIDALAELESLTAEDTGVSSGASLVLMGSTGMPELLREPQLARLGQRVRLRQTINPLGVSELRGYLNHCFRLAGGVFDSVFEAGADEALYRFSDGIPRVCNNIAEQALTTAAEHGLDRVPLRLIESTAAEEIGLTAGHSVEEIRTALAQAEVDKITTATEQTSGLSAEQKQETVEVVANAADPAGSAAETSAPAGAETDAAPTMDEDEAVADDELWAPGSVTAADDLLAGFADELAEELTAGTDDDLTVPELIQDTVQDHEILAPLQDGRNGADEEPIGAHTTVSDATAAAPGRTGHEPMPEWDREPTPAELQPDLDALERAIAVARGDYDEDSLAAESGVETVEETPSADVPEITLDREIQAKIDEAAEALKQTLTDIDAENSAGINEQRQSLETTAGSDGKVEPLPQEDAAASAPGKPESSDQADVGTGPKPDRKEIERVATKLSKARTIEDMDDELAETLFGDDFSMIAAEIAASVANGGPANDELEIETGEQLTAAEENPASLDLAEPDAPEARSPQPPEEPAREIGLDTSASQRLATVRALNNGAVPPGAPAVPEPSETIVLSAQPDIPSSASGTQPESIEQQMNTSMSQTLKALNARSLERDEETDEPKRGFFSRFRRS